MKSSTGLVVITLLLLGCSAAFGEGLVTLGFLDSTGTFQFCDYENFSYGTSLAAGIDVQSACPFNDGSMIGVVATIPASSGYPVTGQLVVLADSFVDGQCNCYSGEQWLNITQTKASKTHFGWELLYNTSDAFNFYFGGYGYLTKHLPPLGPVAEGQKSLRSRVPNSVKR